jgi:protein tyrosine phosphatase (PTP) superfamily phosphohydrolase (DUF442 family)
VRFKIDTKLERLKAWLWAMFVEHNFINPIRYNFHKISDGVYRSSQPTMSQLQRDVKKYNIKTILNLKGTNPNSAYYVFEVEKCKELGIKLIDIEIYSRSIPDANKIKLAKEIFENIEYPMWMHCKAGADRTGLYATLFQYFHLKMPIEKTNQLALIPFGHLKHSKAGKIDYYFEEFAKYKAQHPDAELLDWAENVVDRDKMDKEFKPEGLASFINDYILMRE